MSCLKATTSRPSLTGLSVYLPLLDVLYGLFLHPVPQLKHKNFVPKNFLLQNFVSCHCVDGLQTAHFSLLCIQHPKIRNTGRNRYEHMHMIRRQMAFQHLALPLLGQLMQNISPIYSYLLENFILPVFGYPCHVIITYPC